MWFVVAYFLSLLGLLWAMIQEMRAADWRMSPLTMAVGGVALLPFVNTVFLAVLVIWAIARAMEKR